MNHPLRVIQRHDHNFEESPLAVCSQDEKSGFAFVVLFDGTEWVADRMEGIFLRDAVLPSASSKLHGVNIMTSAGVNTVMTMERRGWQLAAMPQGISGEFLAV